MHVWMYACKNVCMYMCIFLPRVACVHAFMHVCAMYASVCGNSGIDKLHLDFQDLKTLLGAVGR